MEPGSRRALAISHRWKDWNTSVPVALTGLTFLILYWQPLHTLARDWWTDPEAGHGLLLGPLAVVLAWRRGLVASSSPQRALGLGLLGAAVSLRYLSALAAELFTMRLSLLMALGALVIFTWGWRQLRHWWLPATLLFLSVPIPAVILGSLALPLQFKASQLGTAMLASRHIPVLLEGNVIHLPDRSLFVAEACSGLRSLTALLALAALTGGLWLRTPGARLFLVAASVPIAVFLNGLRIFLTGFLVYFLNPALGDGFLHYTEGWAIFVVAFGLLCLLAAALGIAEGRLAEGRTPTDPAAAA